MNPMKTYTLDDFTKLSEYRQRRRETYFNISIDLGKLYLQGELTELERDEIDQLKTIRSIIIANVASLGFSINWLEMTEEEFSNEITKQMEVKP